MTKHKPDTCTYEKDGTRDRTCRTCQREQRGWIDIPLSFNREYTSNWSTGTNATTSFTVNLQTQD